MLAPLTPGADPRLGQLLERLPALGLAVLPLDYERIAQVFAPERELGWEAARELLVALLAKNEEQRYLVRREFRRQFPPVEETSPPDQGGEESRASPDQSGGQQQNGAGEAGRLSEAPGKDSRIIRTPAQRRWPVWGMALGAAWLLIALSVAWIWPRQEVPPQVVLPPPPKEIPSPPPDELPAVPLDYFHDWVPVLEPLGPAAALAIWLPPIALLLGGLLGGAWLWARGRALIKPSYTQKDFDSDAETLPAWSEADLRLPGLLTASQRREMVWGVQRFESEHLTGLLDIAATVRDSAESGLPELRFAPTRYEREVWLWLDSRLGTREAVALADQVEQHLSRAGLRVRRATFPAIPDRIRFATRERASPLDLDSAARQALVALFTDGEGIAQALDRPDSEQAAELQRLLREMKNWPRLCLVDFSPPDLDLPALAERHGLVCIAPDQLPAWLAERALPRTSDQPPETTSDFERRLWASACALINLPVTGVQARYLYQALGLPPAWRLPTPAAGRASADGIRFTEGERRRLLADLARWVWEDGWESEAGHCLKTAVAFWEERLRESPGDLEQLCSNTPGARLWADGRADHELTIERLLLDLWWGDQRTAEAIRELWDRYRLYDSKDLEPLPRLKRLVRERLGEFSAGGLQDGGRIVLPWSWRQLPEAPSQPRKPDDPLGTARQRLLRMGFAGAEPGGRQTLGAETRLLLGAFAGVALAGLIALGQRLAALDEVTLSHDAAVYDSPLFQGLVMERKQAGRLHAASRKLAATRELLPGESLQLHWCWTGLAADQASAACRPLFVENPPDPRRVNVVRLGNSALLRAGSLAEPIRACADRWPELSVAVIAADPWSWPEDPHNNEAARRLAIHLLDKGAVDLALIGPNWAEQASALARDWAFVTDSQWLFFSPGSAGVPPANRGQDARAPSEVPPLGSHRALLSGDLEAMARALDFPGARPVGEALGDKAQTLVLAGQPRLWGGPEVAEGPAGLQFVRLCPGSFTMGSPAIREDTPEHLRPDEDEFPAHAVLIPGFEITRTELTEAQHARLTAQKAPARPDNPMADIDWHEARRLCQRIEPQGDLPSEAQWEYAARGGAQTPYPFPSDLKSLCLYANGAGNESSWSRKNKACSDPFEGVAPAGRFPPNPLGLYDMHGNLWEWVRDCYDEGAYAGRGPGATAAPLADSIGCDYRVLRGGSFVFGPRNLRSADRLRLEPEHRFIVIGFRCVRGSGRQPIN